MFYSHSTLIVVSDICFHSQLSNQIQKWLLGLGATLLFMPLLLKTWRVYYIFHNPLKRKVVRPRMH